MADDDDDIYYKSLSYVLALECVSACKESSPTSW
jgi:hypothetical protein